MEKNNMQQRICRIKLCQINLRDNSWFLFKQKKCGESLLSEVKLGKHFTLLLKSEMYTVLLKSHTS